MYSRSILVETIKNYFSNRQKENDLLMCKSLQKFPCCVTNGVTKPQNKDRGESCIKNEIPTTVYCNRDFGFGLDIVPERYFSCT